MFGFSKKDKNRIVEVTVSNRTVIRVLLLVIVSIVGLTAVQKAAPALMLLFVAFFLALALAGAFAAPAHAEGPPVKVTGGAYTTALGLALYFSDKDAAGTSSSYEEALKSPVYLNSCAHAHRAS